MRFKREHKLKVISLILAVILWYFVVLGKPIEENLEIPILLKNSKSNYLAEVTPSEVVIKVETTRKAWRTFPNKNLKIEIDVSQYSPGVHQIRTPIEKLTFPSDLKIKEVKPNTITLIIKKLITKNLPIKPYFDIDTEIPKKFKLIIKPAWATIKGPIDAIYNISYIKTQPIDISELKEKKEIEVDLVLPSEGLSVSPKKVKIIYKK